MVADGARIPGSSTSTGGVMPPRPRARDETDADSALVAPPKRRGRFDPRNIEFVLKRLAELLSLDIEGRLRQDVTPRGFYLDILV